MSRFIVKFLAGSLLPVGLAFGAAAGALEPGATGLPSCDIQVSRHGGMVELEALAFAPAPATGIYEMQISQGGPAGRSNISQGGAFEAGPGVDGSLGAVSLSVSGNYRATLKVHWNDGTPDCVRQVDSGRVL
ncbi:MAG: curli-like amyloid fiber formation chaperone CsgH [Hyphomicrobiales bacterium]